MIVIQNSTKTKYVLIFYRQNEQASRPRLVLGCLMGTPQEKKAHSVKNNCPHHLRAVWRRASWPSIWRTPVQSSQRAGLQLNLLFVYS